MIVKELSGADVADNLFILTNVMKMGPLMSYIQQERISLKCNFVIDSKCHEVGALK